MERRVAFCSACDRNVPVLVEAPDWSGRAPSVRDATEAVVCLDYGVRCTGAMCPMFRGVEGKADATPNAMTSRTEEAPAAGEGTAAAHESGGAGAKGGCGR